MYFRTASKEMTLVGGYWFLVRSWILTSFIARLSKISMCKAVQVYHFIFCETKWNYSELYSMTNSYIHMHHCRQLFFRL